MTPIFFSLFQTSTDFWTLLAEKLRAISVSPADAVTSFMESVSLPISEVRMAKAFFASLSTSPNFSSTDDFCSSFSPPRTFWRSVNMSTTLLILPASSNTSTPALAILSRTSPRPRMEKAFSISTAARSALCPFPVI